MPWLFVDYDQGAGGEAFCLKLSQSPQCKTLRGEKFPNGRTKVYDEFDQEWLKIIPLPTYKECDSDLFCIVPTHRYTSMAQQMLGKIYSIRIQNPTNDYHCNILKDDKINKVYLTTEATPSLFYGLIRELLRKTNNPEQLKKVKYGTQTIDIHLIARGLEVNEENRKQLLTELNRVNSNEPDYPYDLKIKYEDLKDNFPYVKKQIYDTFGIEIHDV